MIKKGYTLAETLVALGLIGVIAAIMLPLASKFKPDANKVMFLKTYDAVLLSTNKMANNSEMFPLMNEGDSTIYKNYPFANEVEIEVKDKKFSGANKYCNLLGLFMNAENITCNLTPSKDNVSFTTQNGVDFWINTSSSKSDGKVTWQSDVYFDVNGVSQGSNCLYNDTNCKNPDWFKLMVASDGKVIVADPKGQDYLEKRSNWKKTDTTPSFTEIAVLPDEDLTKEIEKTEEESSVEPIKEEGLKCGGEYSGKTLNCLALIPLDSDGNIKIKAYSPVDDDIYFRELPLSIGKPFLALPKGATESTINMKLIKYECDSIYTCYLQPIRVVGYDNYNQIYPLLPMNIKFDFYINKTLESYQFFGENAIKSSKAGTDIYWIKNTDGTFTLEQ